MSLSIGLNVGLSVVNTGGSSGPFRVAITGLTDGVYALVGDHDNIGYTTIPDGLTVTVKWSNSINPSDAATYLDGANPTDYSAGDGGQLFLHVTEATLGTVTKAAPIQKLKATSGAALVLRYEEYFDLTPGIDLTDNWTENGNTISYSIFGTPLPSALTVDTAGLLDGVVGAGAVAEATYTLRGTDSYGRNTDVGNKLEIYETPPDPFAASDWSIEVISPGVIELESGAFGLLLESGTTDKLELEA